MKITSVKIFKDRDGSHPGFLGFATIILDDCLCIRNIRIIRKQADQRMFVAMPSFKDKNGTYRDIAHPINAELRGHIEEVILEAYNSDDQEVK